MFETRTFDNIFSCDDSASHQAESFIASRELQSVRGKSWHFLFDQNRMLAESSVEIESLCD